MKFILFLTCLTLTFYACKKEKKEKVFEPSLGQFFKTDSINGEFSVGRTYEVTTSNTLSYANSQVFMMFFQNLTPTYYQTFPLTVSVGDISLNGNKLKEFENFSYYSDTTGKLTGTPYIWKIEGNYFSRPSVTINYIPEFGSYSTPNLLPDSLNLYQGGSICIGTYSGTFVDVSITAFGGSGFLNKRIYYPENGITLLPNELIQNGFTLSDWDAQLDLGINNVSYKKILGKIFKFTSTTFVSKRIKINS